MVTNEQRIRNQELKEENKKIEEMIEQDQELKQFLADSEASEDIKVIFDLMAEADKKKLLSAGYSIEEVKKFLVHFLTIYDVIIKDMDVDIYKQKSTMVLQLLHAQIKAAKEGIYNRAAKAIKENPDISLKEFYDKDIKEFKKVFKDTFENSEYDEKNLKLMRFVAKVVVATMTIVDMKDELEKEK